MKTQEDVAQETGSAAPGQNVHTHSERRSWPWLAAAFVLCPCHIPILLAIVGTGALGGALARNQAALLAVLGAAFAIALWRGLGQRTTDESCPACRAEQR